MKRGGGGEGPPKKKVSLRGAGVDLPECQERRRGKHKSTTKSVFFWRRRRPLASGAKQFQQRRNHSSSDSAKKDPHRNRHDCSARRRINSVSPLAFALANWAMKLCVSCDHTSARSALTRVVLIANSAPPNRGNPSATTSSLLLSAISGSTRSRFRTNTLVVTLPLLRKLLT